MDTWLAIGNASAGTSDEETIAQVLTCLREFARVDYVATEGPDDLARELADHDDAGLVAVLGGDGSLHAVVQALYDADRLDRTVVGLVPLGTGNDFARTLELPDDPVGSARALAEGTDRAIDLIVDGDDHVVVNAAHLGLGAQAAERSAPVKPVLGPLAYAAGAVSTLFSRTPRLRVRIDDRELGGRIAQVAVGNGRFVGGGGELLPHALVDDGLMDVAVVFASTVPRRIAYALHLSRGTHADEDYVEYTTARRVRVDSAPLGCTSDGELTGPSAVHSWRIVPGALTMRLPVTPAGGSQPTSAS